MYLTAFATGVAGAIGAGGLLGVLFSSWLKRRDREYESLRLHVKDLEERRVAKIEERLRGVERNGCTVGAQMLEQVGSACRQLSRMEDKLDRYTELTAAQGEQIKANAHYIANVDASFQRHKETKHSG